jgi:hypothetical protein
MRYQRLGLLLSAVVACESPFAASRADTSGDLRKVTLRTDRTVYNVAPRGEAGVYRTYAASVVVQLTNGMTGPLYLHRCLPDTPYPIYGIVSAEPGLESAYDPVWACVGHSHPIVVRAGETRQDVLLIIGPNAWDGRTREPLGSLTGRFRVSYAVGICPEVFGCEVPARFQESNEFEVRLEL